MREDCLVIKKITLLIKTHYLTSCPETRIYSQHTLLPHRWSQQKLTKILTENPDGLYISLLLSLLQYLIRD